MVEVTYKKVTEKTAEKNLLTMLKSARREASDKPSRTMFKRHWIFAFTVALFATLFSGVCCQEEALKSVVDGVVDIPCLTSTNDCNDIHSVKWYQNDVRVYVYSQFQNQDVITGSFHPKRAEFWANHTPPVLHISPVKLTDEGTYRCDVTYVSLKPACPTSKSTQLKTLAKPNSPEIYLELPDGDVIGGSNSPVTGTTIGPFHENELISLTCSSSGGKPAAQVTWWNGSQSLGGYFTEETESDGTGVGTNVLRLKINRNDLLARYDCQVMHETLEGGALVTWVEIDVHVPPSRLEMKGKGEVDDGEELSLTCISSGARPAAKIIWYNGSEPIPDQPDMDRENEAGNTFKSTSTLTFSASRYDDEETIRCEASNEAMDGGRGSPLQQQTTLTVYYAPVVRLTSTTGGADQVELVEGGKLQLECAFEANPAANISDITWFHNGHIFRKSTTEAEEVDAEVGRDDAAAAQVNKENDKGGEGEGGKQQGSDNSDKDGRFHLVLNEINRRQSGEYSCAVSNTIGTGVAVNNVNVSVLFAPEVRMVITPSTAVEHNTNVTLSCEVEDANPSLVKRVRWFRDSQLIDESEETIKVLELVDRTDHRNYSCQAENKVGWGQVAEPMLLDVRYTPGRARITHRPPLIIKGQPVTILCELDDPGNPPATEFIWLRGEFLVTNVRSFNWSMQTADLTTQDEYTCNARNAAGEGIAAKAHIDVNAAPSFITALMNSTGALETAKDISLTCQVECDPRCSIDWFKNGELLTVDRPKNGANVDETMEEDEEENVEGAAANLNDNNDEVEEESLHSPYSVKVSYLPPNFKHLHFSSVVSTLRWNLSAWTNKRLDRALDLANYTCRSSPNLAGIGVNSTTQFEVEYPPENITLSTNEIEIEEGQILPSPITCKADGKPKVRFIWTFEGESEPVSGTNELNLNFPALREKSGVYTCIASNPYGNISAKVSIDVQYKPECRIHASMEEDGSTILTCEVEANPEDVDFVWLLNNETVKNNVHTRGMISRLKDVRAGGKYFCVVNNSVGVSEEGCVIELQGAEGALIAGFSDNRIIIIVVVVAAIIIVSVIACIVIVLVMKRRGSTGKLSKPPRNQAGVPGDGERAFYENLPFHGLQPAPNKPFKPFLPDLEYADVDFSSANQGQQQQPPPPPPTITTTQPPSSDQQPKETPPPPLPQEEKETPEANDVSVVPEKQQLEPVEEDEMEEQQDEPAAAPVEEQQKLLQPERPPRANKNVLNNSNHA